VRGTLEGQEPEKSLSGPSIALQVEEMIKAIEEHGIRTCKVVYFPGNRHIHHAAKDPLEFPEAISRARDRWRNRQSSEEYSRHNALDNTYVIFIADHSHIPTMNDEKHRLGPDDDDSPFKSQ